MEDKLALLDFSLEEFFEQLGFGLHSLSVDSIHKGGARYEITIKVDMELQGAGE